MTNTSQVHPSDLLGFSRLAIDGTTRLADLVEAMHQTIVRAPGLLDRPIPGPGSGTAALVYESVREMTRSLGGGIDSMLEPLIPRLGERHSDREAVLAALNGVMGDYLVRPTTLSPFPCASAETAGP